MESDDDYQSFSPPQEEPSPQLHHRKLKRLKKAIHVAKEVVSVPLLPVEKSLESRDLESQWVHEAFGGESELGSGFGGQRNLGFGGLGDGERSGRGGGKGENVSDLEMERDEEKRVNESRRCDGDDDDGEELNCGFDGVKFGEEGKEVERVLDFDDIGERVEKKRVNKEDLIESEGRDGDDDVELNCGFDGMGFGDGRKETKRVLDFGDTGGGFEGERLNRSGGVEESIADLKKVKHAKKRVSEEDSSEVKGRKKKKEKKGIESDGDDVKPKTSSSNRRREEKVV